MFKKKTMIFENSQTKVQRILRFKRILFFCVSSISFVEKSIFVAEKRLLYEKASIFDGEYDGTKIKLIA